MKPEKTRGGGGAERGREGTTGRKRAKRKGKGKKKLSEGNLGEKHCAYDSASCDQHGKM